MLKIAKRKETGVYTRMLIAIFSTVSATILLSASLFYAVFQAKVTANLEASSIDTLSEISYTSSMMMDLAKSTALQLYLNDSLTPLFGYNITDDNDPDLVSALYLLKSYKLTNPYIQSIYFYNRKTNNYYTTVQGQQIVSKDSFFDKQINALMDNYSEPRFLYPIARQIRDYNAASLEKYQNVFTFIFNDTRSSTRLDNAVIINFTEDWMRNAVIALNSVRDSTTIIVDKQGNLLLNANAEVKSEESRPSGDYLQKVLDDKANSGTLISTVDGKKTFVSYVHAKATDWTFIRLTPYRVYFEEISRIRLLSLYVAAGILLIGFTISFFISRKLYIPFSTTAKELDSMRFERNRQLNQDRNLYLMKLVHSSELVSLPAMSQRFQALHVKVDPSWKSLLLKVQIDQYAQFAERYSFNDQMLMVYSVLNVVSEVMSSAFTNEFILSESETDHGLIVMNGNDLPVDEMESRIEMLAAKAQEAVRNYLKLTVTLSVSEPIRSLQQLNQAYRQVQTVAKNRLVRGHQSILLASRFDRHPIQEYVYPYEREKKLTDLLRLQKFEEAKAVYLDMIEEAKGHSFSMVHYVLIRLASAINMMIDLVEKPSGMDILMYNMNAFISVINAKETIEEINEEFFELFHQLIQTLEERNANPDQLERNDKIIAHIQENYKDFNLSLESIADEFNLSSNYLGRTFKKQHMISVSDFITRCRIERAKQLLKDTNLTVSHITELCGFTNTKYFCTLFKKMNGVTPSVYRKY